MSALHHPHPGYYNTISSSGGGAEIFKLPEPGSTQHCKPIGSLAGTVAWGAPQVPAGRPRLRPPGCLWPMAHVLWRMGYGHRDPDLPLSEHCKTILLPGGDRGLEGHPGAHGSAPPDAPPGALGSS